MHRSASDAPELARWAPKFFVERLREIGVRDGLATLVRREATRRVADVLRDLGVSGVLLKGTALMLRDAEARPPRNAARNGRRRSPCRAVGCASPARAADRRGFRGRAES